MRVHARETRAVGRFAVVCAIALIAAACSSSSKTAIAGGGSGPSGSSGSTTITAAVPSASNPAPFAAPSDPIARAKAAGLVPEDAEQLEYHVHSHLDVFLDGQHLIVPAGLGIDITNPGVHKFETDGLPSYGGIAVPCNKPCISPLHTHDITGVLHTESSTSKDNTLGQLFIEWNVKLSATCFATYCSPAKSVAIYVNGAKFSGDPTTIPLSNLKEIAIIVGTPPAQIPNSFDQSQI